MHVGRNVAVGVGRRRRINGRRIDCALIVGRSIGRNVVVQAGSLRHLGHGKVLLE